MRTGLCLMFMATSLSDVRPVDSFSVATRPRRPRVPFTSHNGARLPNKSPTLFSQESDGSLDDQIDGNDSDTIDYTHEETLLCIDLAVRPGVEWETARAKVSKFCQSFPFAAVLPVQPLQYVPVYEDGGVEVKFLRKKTALKSSNDGGIRFFVQPLHPLDDTDDTPTDSDGPVDETDGDVDATLIIQVTAKRNSQGQTIAKLFAEKLVVTSFVAGLTGTPSTAGQPTFGQAPSDYVQVRSLYHKWM